MTTRATGPAESNGRAGWFKAPGRVSGAFFVSPRQMVVNDRLLSDARQESV
jgi:hypothetical protein